MARYFNEEIKDICELNNNKYIISCLVDFDGTIVKHRFPLIGEPVPHALDLMREYTQKYNCGWILDTMRSGKLLQDAVQWCEERGMKFYGIGTNPIQKTWTDSSKAYGIFSIDDRNLGVPLIMEKGCRPRVDWKKIDEEYSPLIEKISKVN